jgi:hypothetical protein
MDMPKVDMPKRLRAGILGDGRMGRGFVAAMKKDEEKRALGCSCGVRCVPPGARTGWDCSPWRMRVPNRFRKLWRVGSMRWQKSRWVGKFATEWQLERQIQASNRLVAVDLFDRDAE